MPRKKKEDKIVETKVKEVAPDVKKKRGRPAKVAVVQETENLTLKSEKKNNVKENLPQYYYAVGRRKTASARVRLYLSPNPENEINGKTYTRGQVIVNDLPVEKYFPSASDNVYLEPFRTTNTLGRFITTVKVIGSGKNSQMEAMVHGISRAIETIDPIKYRPILKKRKFLTRDSRARERRKAGIMGARTRKQSPKR